MKPNIFLHYWSSQDQLLSFQEVLSLNFDPVILATIQTELLQQMTSEGIQEKLPNFDWTNLRMQEKWNSLAQTLIMQVQLPEQIWMDWINSQRTKIESTQPEIPSFADLLNAEVYYERPSDTLEDLLENEENLAEIAFEDNVSPKTEIEEIDLQVVARENENSTMEILSTIIPDYVEVATTLPELDTTTTEDVKTQSIKEMLADSTEEKVLDTIQMDENSLKNLVANQMTSSLAESISLFQRLNFIQDLFDGNAEQFSQFIEFIDFQASPIHWKAELAERYEFPESPAYQELNTLIERKFS